MYWPAVSEAPASVPRFVDNRRETRSPRRSTVREIDNLLADDPNLDIVTGYSTPRDCFSVAEGLEHADRVRLLIGTHSEYEGPERWRQRGEPPSKECVDIHWSCRYVDSDAESRSIPQTRPEDTEIIENAVDDCPDSPTRRTRRR